MNESLVQARVDLPPAYFHATNLETPFDDTDLAFLQLLGTYRIGPPVETEEKDAQQLMRAGIIGLYTTPSAIARPEIRKRTGWSASVLSPITLDQRLKELANG